MRFLFFRKIRHWRSADKQRRKLKKGAITLISAFLFFVFSTLGMSMLYISQIYIKLSAYKKNSILLDYASENGIKQGFNQLVNLLSEASFPSILTPEETNELKEDALNSGKKILEKLLGPEIPLNNSATWEKLSWETSTLFFLKTIEEKDDYFKAVYKAEIRSEGRIKNFKPKRESTLESTMEILIGNLSLPKIPLLIDKKLNQEQGENYMEKNKIEILPSDENSLPPQINFSEEKLLPQEANSQLNKALKIKIFYPQNLSTARLRTALGLEETSEPVPEGVYLIKDDLGLGGIYVQGDLEEMVLALEGGFQIISFLTQHGCWVLKFSPSKSKTIFSSPTEKHFYDFIPLGIIIVNGEIRSLGGGIVDSSGQVILVKEEEIPSILHGVNMTIISSDKINLSSHLIQQGLKWKEGIPYLKDSNSQLIIFATGKDFLEGSEREGKIVVDRNSPKEIKVQASLTASGKGFSVEGEGKTVHILGSLQASDYTSNKNKLKITFDSRVLEENSLLQNAPQTTKPVLLLSSFKPMEWKEF